MHKDFCKCDKTVRWIGNSWGYSTSNMKLAPNSTIDLT
jgi:hypothetical protein